jgi:uncharacterized glyoxalase superfamily protein PhnB
MNTVPNQAGISVNRSMPPGTIIPELVYDDLDAAVAWLCATFGFRERLRIGNHRSQITVGAGAAIVIVQATTPASESPRSALSHSLMVRVDDVDGHYAHVAQSGARIISPPTDFPFGERQYTVEDLSGRRWTFSQSIADVDPQSWGGALREGADDTATKSWPKAGTLL